MKKIAVSLILVLALILPCAFAEAAQPADILTAENWVNSVDTCLTFNADGSAKMVNSSAMEFEGAWNLSGENIHFTYNFYGERSIDFMLIDDNGVPCLTTPDGSASYYPESQFEAVRASSNADLTLYPIKMNEEINLGFTKLTFDSVESTRKIGGSSSWYSSASGNNMLCLVGNLENTGNIEYNAGNIAAEFYINDEYTYIASVRGVTGDKLGTNVPPLSSCRYYIFLELPDALEQNVSSCKVRFSLNDQFKTKPAFLGNGEFCFEVEMDADALAQAMSGPLREKVYFEECPILPTPESYVDMRFSGSSKNSSNGKVTSIKYSYSALINNDDILVLYNQYTSKLAEDGFTLKETGINAHNIFDGDNKLAEIKVDMDAIRFSITPGNEKLTERSSAAAAAVPAEKENDAMYSVGDNAVLGPLRISIEKSGTTDKIYSSITPDSGWYSYYDDDGTGNKLFYIYGSIKNEGTVPVDIDNIYTQFEFDGAYKYSGDIAGVSKGSSNFIRDLAPLTTTNFYVFTPLPDELLNSFEDCLITLGASEDFSIKFSSEGGLYNFDRCDYIITIDASRNAAASAADKLKEYTDKATVKKVQAALNNCGYPCGTPDGAAGKKTKAALRDYQSDKGLTVTGTITHETLMSLGI